MLATVAAGATSTCVMCGVPVPHSRADTPTLCGRPACAHRHAVMPENQKCRVCMRPLEPVQWASGVCADMRCREEWLSRRPRRLIQEAFERMIAGSGTKRDRAAARRGIPRDERASWRVSVLPRNEDRSSRLPRRRRNAFEAHLRRTLAEARQRIANGEALPSPPATAPVDFDDRLEAQREAELALLAAGCAACRGKCCRGGANHAYNSSDTMVGYLQRFPDHDDETIVARYLSYLQPRTMTNGCVYQVHDGCSLPRDLRANICNAFYCGGLNMIRNTYEDGDPIRAYFVHTVDNTLKRGQFVQIQVRKD